MQSLLKLLPSLFLILWTSSVSASASHVPYSHESVSYSESEWDKLPDGTPVSKFIVNKRSSISTSIWGRMPDGSPVKIINMSSGDGMTVSVITYGATIQSIYYPGRNGHYADMVLGFPDLKGYLKDTFGQTIGRYANRIAHGRFTLKGKNYQLQTTAPWPALHGGGTGFHMRNWSLDSATLVRGTPTLVLSYDSPDGDQNFPGKLKTTATFTLKKSNRLRIDFKATTSKITLVNLTEHTYFNLAGDASGTVLDQLLSINADKYTPTDSMLVPNGLYAKVADTPLDFRDPKFIGWYLRKKPPTKCDMLNYGHGYDLNYVLRRKKPNDLVLAAMALDIPSGRRLEVYTTQPGVQFYSGNWLNSSEPGVGGKKYTAHDGFALECQRFPDSPNHSNFPSAELDPGQRYHQVIEYRFSRRKERVSRVESSGF